MTITYAAYDDTAIHGTGSTADAALAAAGETNNLSTAPMTKYLASYIEKHGFDGNIDGFGLVNNVIVSERAYWRLSGQRNRH